MKRLRGPATGEHLTPRQYANGWISADSAAKQGVILKPDQVRLDPEDFAFFAAHDARQHGHFWRDWDLQEDGTFLRLAGATAR